MTALLFAFTFIIWPLMEAPLLMQAMSKSEILIAIKDIDDDVYQILSQKDQWIVAVNVGFFFMFDPNFLFPSSFSIDNRIYG